MEETGSMRPYRYRRARAGRTFVRVAFDSSGRNEGVLLLYDPSHQGLIYLDELSWRTCSWKPTKGALETGQLFCTMVISASQLDHLQLFVL